MLTHRKNGTVEPGQVVKAVAVGYAIEVGSSPQTLDGRSGLVGGMVAGVLLMSAGVVSGAVEAKEHEKNLL